ncbi:MAG: threonine synthase, partial [Cyclobacteriaceae bacterium]
NIRALEVDGTFDDCQKLVKTAFLDEELNKQVNLSSANSINIARLIPQSFYYFYAFQQLENWDDVIVAVPSGNYGNMTAGLLAWKMGLPIKRFIASSNANRVVPDYLLSGKYDPKPSIRTYANAMDVGAPSNFVRMLELFGGDFEQVTSVISGYCLVDEGILQVMATCAKERDYILDPHGAIGYQALVENLEEGEQGIFLETAHPVKFLDVVEKALGQAPDYKTKIADLLEKESSFEQIGGGYEEFREIFLR